MAILNLYFRHMLQANGEECIACPHLYAIPRQVEADVTTWSRPGWSEEMSKLARELVEEVHSLELYSLQIHSLMILRPFDSREGQLWLDLMGNLTQPSKINDIIERWNAKGFPVPVHMQFNIVIEKFQTVPEPPLSKKNGELWHIISSALEITKASSGRIG